MLKIRNYPFGYDLSLLQTVYHKTRKINGEWHPDQLDLVIKDNVTGEKFVESIVNPEYTWYKVKSDIYLDHNLFFAPKDMCEPVSCEYRKRLWSIAEEMDQTKFYLDNMDNGDYANNQKLHMMYRVMGSDIDIEDYYRFLFSESYQNNLGTLDKSYLDIEVDSRTAKGDFVEPGECPINAVTFIDERVNTVFTFLLRDEDNPLCLEFEKTMKEDGFQNLVRNFIIASVGGIEKAKKYKIDNLEFQMSMFGDEKELIRNLFNVINTIEPDFLLAWNMAFDMPYIIERCKNLKMRPEQIMCHPDFNYKEAFYWIDEDNKNEFEERNDFFRISSKTVYLDQLIQFASRRKGRSAIPNYRLDTIAEMTVGFGKLDYKHICNNLEDLPQKDYLTFVLYNIMDVISQVCIERKSNDIGNAQNNVLVNNTRISKIYRQTVYLKNRAYKSFWRNGFILGNNVNKNNKKVRFPGAWVSDPTKNGPYSKMVVNGVPISVYNNLNDFDFKALYPSITSENNMSPNTIIAHITIENMVYALENRFGRDDYKYKREGQFLEDLQSHQWLEFYHRWFHLASVSEMYDDVIEFFTNECHARGKLDIHNSRGRAAFTKIPNTNRGVSPFINMREMKRVSNMEYPHKVYPYAEGQNSLTDVYNEIQSRNMNTYNLLDRIRVGV